MHKLNLRVVSFLFASFSFSVLAVFESQASAEKVVAAAVDVAKAAVPKAPPVKPQIPKPFKPLTPPDPVQMQRDIGGLKALIEQDQKRLELQKQHFARIEKNKMSMTPNDYYQAQRQSRRIENNIKMRIANHERKLQRIEFALMKSDVAPAAPETAAPVEQKVK